MFLSKSDEQQRFTEGFSFNYIERLKGSTANFIGSKPHNRKF
jgi:hypothetical protein